MVTVLGEQRNINTENKKLNEVEAEQGEKEQIIPLQQLKDRDLSIIKFKQYQPNNLHQFQNTPDQKKFSNKRKNIANLSRPVSLKSVIFKLVSEVNI